VHIIDPKAQPFADALTTAAITCFRLGAPSGEIAMRSVGSLGELAPLAAVAQSLGMRSPARASGPCLYVNTGKPQPD
jgi:hypothetical protein